MNEEQQEHDRDEGDAHGDESDATVRDQQRDEEEWLQCDKHAREPCPETEQQRDERERDRDSDEDDILMSDESPERVRQVRRLLVIQNRLYGLRTRPQHEQPHEDRDLTKVSHEIRGEEVRQAQMERSAELREGDIGVPVAASRCADIHFAQH